MFKPLAVIPETELEMRWRKCRRFMIETAPEAGGMLVFTRLNIYYLSGTMGQGVLWLPLEGKPVLMLRKGLERGRLESVLEQIVPFKSYSQLPDLCAEAGSPLSRIIGAETTGLSWQLGTMLSARLVEHEFQSCDMALALARSVKSPWELEIMRRCGRLHNEALTKALPGMIRPGMTEREISHLSWQAFFNAGHQGMMRMQSFGEEIFLGHVSAGDSGNYPSSFNGPLGLRGEHPSLPFMGSADVVWKKGQPLSCDIGFSLEGYCTDKTQVYWSGSESSIPDEVRSAHSFCMEVQAWVAENARPGTLPSELYTHCLEWAKRDGFAEGFMGLGDNKVPFIGHGIGLTIDGYPPIAKGFDRPLEQGMVLAVEPKQGIPGVGMVGVENTFEVKADRARCITGNSFDIICVE